MNIKETILRIGDFSLDLSVTTGYKNNKGRFPTLFYINGNYASMNKSSYVILTMYSQDKDIENGKVVLSSWDLCNIKEFIEEVNDAIFSDDVIDSFKNPDNDEEIVEQINPKYRKAFTVTSKAGNTLGFQLKLLKRKKSDQFNELGGFLIVGKNDSYIEIFAEEWITIAENITNMLSNLSLFSNQLVSTYMTYEGLKRKTSTNIMSKLEELD